MEKKCEITGIFPAMITPFNFNRTVDYQSTMEVIDFFIQSGVQGIYVLGTTGEWPLISKEQRKSILEFVMGYVKGRIPVMAHIGALPVIDACELASHAETLGVSAISSIPPYYFPFKEADIESYYESILASISVKMPLLFYNIPGFARNIISVKTVVRLMEQHPNIVGIKDSQGDPETFKAYIKAIGDNGVVLVGSDGMILQAFQMGGSGVISGNANVVPELFIKLFSAYRTGKKDLAKDLQTMVNELSEATHFGRTPLLKAGLQIRGVPAGYAMKPYNQVVINEERDRLESVIHKILHQLKNLSV